MSRLLKYNDNISDITIDISKVPAPFYGEMERMAEIINSLCEQNRELLFRNKQLKDAVLQLSLKAYHN